DGIRDPLVTGVQTCALPICVLQFDGEPVEAGPGHELSGDRIGQGEPGADAGFAAFEFSPDGVGFHVGCGSWRRRRRYLSAARSEIGRASCRERREGLGWDVL